jgi:hypothetical protein
MDVKSLAAVEKLTGQPIPAMEGEGRGSRPQQLSSEEPSEAAEQNRGERPPGGHNRGERKRGGRSARPRQDRQPERQAERQPERQPERQAERPVERAPRPAQPAAHRPAHVAKPQPEHDNDSDGSHLPAFLLRPVTLKA